MGRYTQQQKSVLAKLLATENITVEHRNIETAMFDVSNRVLILPTWEDMSESVYDMLVGHEVGHALFTPSDVSTLEEVINSIDENYPGRIKTLLNIVEDARIEKKMKRKFPGLRRDFHQGYREFIDEERFGDLSDPDGLFFIDKLNIQFKAGPLAPKFSFTPHEEDFISRISDVETFDGVVDIVRDLYEYVGSTVPENLNDDIEWEINSDEKSSGWEQEGASEGQDTEPGNENPQEDISNNDLSGDYGDDTRDPSGDDQSTEEVTCKEGGRSYSDNPYVSVTQEAMDDYIKESYDSTSLADLTLTIPQFDSSRYIEDYKSVLEGLEDHFNGGGLYSDKWFVRKMMESDITSEVFHSYLVKGYRDWKGGINASVNYMAKEFEMQKAADQYARASVNKTGTLNTNKIHEYKYNEDLFRRITILPDGKDHAMIMLVDWSGSMDRSITATIQQVMTLVLFCRKVNIPFEVYCFSDSPSAYRDVIRPLKSGDYIEKDIFIDYFVMRNMFSSRMNTKELDKALTYFYAISIGFSHNQNPYRQYIEEDHMSWGFQRNLIPHGWGLGGTPLNDSLIALRDYIERYRKENIRTILNVVVLTDGDSATSSNFVTHDAEASDASSLINPGYVQYTDDKDQAQYYEDKLSVEDVKLMHYSHNRINLRIKDTYTNNVEYVTQLSERGKWVSNWYRSEHTNVTNTLIRSFTHIPRVNMIGFFIANSRYDAKNAVGTHLCRPSDDYEKHGELLKKFKKDKYLVSEDHDGYDIFFVISAEKSDLELETGGLSDDLVGESKRKLTTAFKKKSKAKLQSRVLLNKFIERISKENF